MTVIYIKKTKSLPFLRSPSYVHALAKSQPCYNLTQILRSSLQIFFSLEIEAFVFQYDMCYRPMRDVKKRHLRLTK